MLKIIKCINYTYVIFLPVEIRQALQAKTISVVRSLLVNKREKRDHADAAVSDSSECSYVSSNFLGFEPREEADKVFL